MIIKKDMKMENVIVIHYDEIGLKGKNRGKFEKLLIDNIKTKLGKLMEFYSRESGCIVIKPSQNVDFSKIKDVLLRVPGIAYFSFAKQADLNIDNIKKDAIEFLKSKEYETFKIDTKRYDKNYKINSLELNALLGELVVNIYGKKVRMKNPDVNLRVEISDKNAYLSCENIKGVGGLPTNQKQKVIALISGGFDSPVAAYLIMKRGCEVVFVHFQNKNQMSYSVEDKIVKLTSHLSKYQIKTKLYIIPFENIQKEIIKKVNSTLRMLVYRRFMIMISSKIAYLNKARFLVVGDSLSQVASQTLENLEATYHNSEKHILSPLIGMDKKDIVDISRQIGTYDISSLPYGDCCSYFLPKHPVLNSRAFILDNIESKFNINFLIEDAVKKAKILEF